MDRRAFTRQPSASSPRRSPPGRSRGRFLASACCEPARLRIPTSAGVPAGAARAGIRRGAERRHRVPLGGGEARRLADLAAELVRLKVDVIMTGGRRRRKRQEGDDHHPHRHRRAADPAATGLVASLARPGGNVTGLTVVNVEMSAKKVELLREALPNVSRVAVLWDPTNAEP